MLTTRFRWFSGGGFPLARAERLVPSLIKISLSVRVRVRGRVRVMWDPL